MHYRISLRYKYIIIATGLFHKEITHIRTNCCYSHRWSWGYIGTAFSFVMNFFNDAMYFTSYATGIADISYLPHLNLPYRKWDWRWMLCDKYLQQFFCPISSTNKDRTSGLPQWSFVNLLSSMCSTCMHIYTRKWRRCSLETFFCYNPTW